MKLFFLLLAQTTTTSAITSTVIDKWIEPGSIITVLAILSLVEGVVVWKLAKMFFETITHHTNDQKELFEILRQSTLDITKTITELTTIVKERLER